MTLRANSQRGRRKILARDTTRMVEMGDATGNIYATRANYYRVREILSADEDGNPVYGPVFEVFANVGAGIVPAPGRKIRIRQDAIDGWVVDKPDRNDIAAAGYDVRWYEPANPYNKFVRLEQIQNLNAYDLNAGLKVSVRSFQYDVMVGGVRTVKFFAGTDATSHVDLTAHVPGTLDTHRYALLVFNVTHHLAGTDPLEVYPGDAISLFTPLDFDDMQTCYDDLPADDLVIPIRAFYLQYGQTRIAGERFDVDVRGIINVPDNETDVSTITGILSLAHGGTGADLSATGGANQFVRQSTSGGAFTVSSLASADLTTALTTPPAIGGTTPNTGRFTTVGIGVAPGTPGLEVRHTTQQLRLSYDASNYAVFNVASNGSLSITPTLAVVTVAARIATTGTHSIRGWNIESLNSFYFPNHDLLMYPSAASGDSGNAYIFANASGSTLRQIRASSLTIAATLAGTALASIDTAGVGRFTDVRSVTTDTATSTIVDVLTLAHNSSGTAAGSSVFGEAIHFKGKSSTTPDRSMGRIKAVWPVATDASRVSKMTVSVYNVSTETDVADFTTTGIESALDMKITDSAKGLILKDRTDASLWRLVVTSGVLSIESA